MIFLQTKATQLLMLLATLAAPGRGANLPCAYDRPEDVQPVGYAIAEDGTSLCSVSFNFTVISRRDGVVFRTNGGEVIACHGGRGYYSDINSDGPYSLGGSELWGCEAQIPCVGGTITIDCNVGSCLESLSAYSSAHFTLTSGTNSTDSTADTCFPAIRQQSLQNQESSLVELRTNSVSTVKSMNPVSFFRPGGDREWYYTRFGTGRVTSVMLTPSDEDGTEARYGFTSTGFVDGFDCKSLGTNTTHNVNVISSTRVDVSVALASPLLCSYVADRNGTKYVETYATDSQVLYGTVYPPFYDRITWSNNVEQEVVSTSAGTSIFIRDSAHGGEQRAICWQ